MPVKKIQGDGGGGKGGGSAPVSGYEGADTLFSSSSIEVLYLVGEGEMGGLTNGLKSLYIDGTPVMSEDGNMNHKVQMQSRNGTQSQAPIALVTGASLEESINLRVFNATPVVFTIDNPEATHAVVTLGFPRLMVADNLGNISGTTVEYKIECQPFGEAYSTVSVTTAAKKGVYNTTAHYFQSPALTSHATCYINSSSLSVVDVEHSSDGGATWSLLQKVDLVRQVIAGAYRDGSNYVATVKFTFLEGNHLLRWGNDAETFYTLLNHVEWVSVVGTPGTVKVTGKTGSRYQAQQRFELTGASPWLVRVTRITGDATDSKVANELWCDYARTEVAVNFAYPNSALLHIKVSSTEFNAMPKVTSEWHCMIIKIPSNYDPIARTYITYDPISDTYSDIWDGTFKMAVSNNPAWCFYDLAITKRYGAGQHINEAGINKWLLYEIGKYCDEMVDSGSRDSLGAIIYEPRFTLNIQIMNAKEAFNWLNDLVTVFRGMMYVVNGKLVCVSDKPSDPVCLFNQANVIDGEFTITGTSGLSKKTVALVRWKDPKNLYLDAVPEFVPNRAGIKRYGYNIIDATAIGCTSRGQAHRLGKWLLVDLEAVSFRVASDAVFVQPGDVIQCAIPLRAKGKRMGGRIASIIGTTVTVDAPIYLDAAKSYQLTVVIADGSLQTRDLVVTLTGEATTLVVASEFVGEIVNQAVWVLTDLSTVERSLWRVLSISDTRGMERTISATSFDPEKYALIDTFDNPIDDSIVNTSTPLNILAPTEIVVENMPFTDKNGIVQNKLIVHWTQVLDASKYRINWRVNDGVWSAPEIVFGTLWELPIKNDGVYEFGVSAIGGFNRQSPVTLKSVTVVGDSSFFDVSAQWVP